MKNNLYIFNNSILKRRGNTILCEKILDEGQTSQFDDEQNIQQKEEYFLSKEIEIPTGDKKYIPVKTVESVIAFGEVRFNSRFLYFLSLNSIPLHIYNQKGKYTGSYIPQKNNIIGKILLSEAVHYQDKRKKLILAKEFVKGAANNSLANLKYYNNRMSGLNEEIILIEDLKNYINNTLTVEELRGIEGNIKKIYYSAWSKILLKQTGFVKRIKNPPLDMVNSLISYGNMIVYSLCLNELYFSGLYPEVGYLHEAGFGKMPLSYDLAEIFKPLLTDKIIFKVINKNMITEKDFIIKNNSCIIKTNAKRIFVNEFNKKLYTITRDKARNKRYSYKMLIKEECVKLKKHFFDEKQYKPFLYQ